MGCIAIKLDDITRALTSHLFIPAWVKESVWINPYDKEVIFKSQGLFLGESKIILHAISVPEIFNHEK